MLVEQGLRRLRARRQVAPRRARLDHHDADGVGDDVVQLAGDARPFLGDTFAGEEVAFALGPLGPVGEGLDVQTAPAQVVAEHERRREHPERGDGVDDSDLVARPRPSANSTTMARPAAPSDHARRGGLGVRTDRVDGHDDPVHPAPTTSSTSQAIWAATTTSSTAAGVRRRHITGSVAATVRSTVQPGRIAERPFVGRLPDGQVDDQGADREDGRQQAVGGERVLAEPADRPSPQLQHALHGTDATEGRSGRRPPPG